MANQLFGTNLPRKEVIRLLLSVMKKSKIPTTYDGEHRYCVEQIVDAIEILMSESKYKIRFDIVQEQGNTYVYATNKRVRQFYITLNDFSHFINKYATLHINKPREISGDMLMQDLAKDSFMSYIKLFMWIPV
jgi:hypothetical protein